MRSAINKCIKSPESFPRQTSNCNHGWMIVIAIVITFSCPAVILIIIIENLMFTDRNRA